MIGPRNFLPKVNIFQKNLAPEIIEVIERKFCQKKNFLEIPSSEMNKAYDVIVNSF